MFTLPEIDLSKFDISAVRNITLPGNVRDAAYMTVGLGVVAAEKIQARRQQLSDRVTETISERLTQVREMIRTAV